MTSVGDEIRQRRQEWEDRTASPALERYPEPPDVRTQSGIVVERVYTPDNSPPEETYLNRLGFPGELPFTRGAYATGYRARPWTRRPITGFSMAELTNLRVQELLRSGQTGLHFVFDYPTLAGYDSDDDLAAGEVGVTGIPIDSLADVEALLQDIPIGELSISYSHWGPYILSFLLAYARNQGVPWETLSGTTQNDVLMYYHSCPWWDLPLEANLKLFTDVVEFAVDNMPRWHPVSISGYNIRDGGCSAIHEIAFTLGDAITYLEHAIERGLSVDDVARRFSFMLCAHNDFFEEIAKMRALRRMWAHLVTDRFGATDPRAQALRFHGQTSGASLTAQMPLNNVVRGTLQGLAAVLGGAQSLHISCFDETYGVPTEEAAQVSLNTQNIIALESGVTATVDPLGGSYFVEALTDELEAASWKLLAEIEERGGMVEAAKSGWVSSVKTEWALQHQQRMDEGRALVVGVNAFKGEGDPHLPFTRPDVDVQQEQAKRTREFRAKRDQARAIRALDELHEAAAVGVNVMPAAIEAAAAHATLGEMYAVMRSVFGEVSAAEKQFLR